MFAETKPVLTYPFHELNLADISLVIMLSKVTNFVKKKLFSAGIAETFSCSIAQINKKAQNFLQGQYVSGNFATKLHYYFQVCRSESEAPRYKRGPCLNPYCT